MHGLIHVVLKSFVVERFGADKWAAILRELDLADDAPILMMVQHDDATTVAGVQAAAKVLGVSFDDALRAYGGYFVEFVHTGKHLRMLRSMGDDLREFLRNINHLHYNLERQFRDADFPFFHVDPRGASTSFTLSYRSVRGSALSPLVEGVLPALARMLHRQDVAMEAAAAPADGFHATWAVTTAPAAAGSEVRLNPETAKVAEKEGGAWHTALMTHSTDKNAHKDAAKALPAAEKKLFDDLQARVEACGGDESSVSDVLMRAVPAARVAAEWTDDVALDEAQTFWSTNAGDAAHFKLSEPSARAMRFVSHSWSAPSNWTEVMGQHCSYGDVKATELCTLAKDLAERGGDWRGVTFWVDKCCVPQNHPLMPRCIAKLEDFLRRCDGMLVLLSWHYFERLWCVYEWASFLVFHDAKAVNICVDAFLRPASEPLYLDSIRRLRIADCKCAHEPDRAILQRKVAAFYTSEAAFERFAQGTAIGILAMTAARASARGARLRPWVDLARELSLTTLAAALENADPVAWRARAHKGGAQTLGRQGREYCDVLNAIAREWFAAEVSPALEEIKRSAVRPEVLALST